MKTLFLSEPLKYDGSQLRSLFGYLQYQVLGDSVVAFRGPCDIPFEHMVDGEDLNQKAKIAGSDMVHFIVEKFDWSLKGAVALQRLMTGIAGEVIADKTGVFLRREGDDLYFEDKKLSISIATASPTSSMIHFAVNVSNEGTPVPTYSLSDLNLSVEDFVIPFLDRLKVEFRQIEDAAKKVRPVGSF